MKGSTMRQLNKILNPFRSDSDWKKINERKVTIAS